MFTWNSDCYSHFLKERTQPAIVLAAKIPLEAPDSILDLGCGPGNSTKVLADRFPHAAHLLGVDLSPDMLQHAKAKYPELSYQAFDATCDFETLSTQFDVIFSNACIQWVPDHPRLLRNMQQALKPGGVLAVQIPMNQNEPIHQIIQALVTSATWRSKFPSPRIFYTLTPEKYFDLLSELFEDFSIWETTYCHRMPSHQSILEWYRGTGLRPYLAALSPEDAAALEADVLRELQQAYPIQKNGEILFRFPRFFLTATKAAASTGKEDPA